MTDNPGLPNRVSAIEAELARTQRSERLARFRSMYPALMTAIVVLPWFPKYASDLGDDVSHSAGSQSLTTIFTVALTLGTLLLALRTELGSVAAPIVVAVVAALNAVALLTELGASEAFSLSGAGKATVAVLCITTVVGIVHAIALHNVLRRTATGE